jgi:hypothetical protein
MNPKIMYLARRLKKINKNTIYNANLLFKISKGYLSLNITLDNIIKILIKKNPNHLFQVLKKDLVKKGSLDLYKNLKDLENYVDSINIKNAIWDKITVIGAKKYIPLHNKKIISSMKLSSVYPEDIVHKTETFKNCYNEFCFLGEVIDNIQGSKIKILSFVQNKYPYITHIRNALSHDMQSLEGSYFIFNKENQSFSLKDRDYIQDLSLSQFLEVLIFLEFSYSILETYLGLIYLEISLKIRSFKSDVK